MFMFVRAVNNLTLPIVPRYDSALKPYIQQLRALQDKNGPQEGFRLFVKQNPDMWYINASLTKNPSGVDSTTLSVHLAKKNSSLVDDLLSKKPKDDMKYVSLVTDTLVAGQFDTAANLWKRRSGFVERKDVQSALRDSRVAMGWLRYHEIQDKYQGELDRLKLPNMQVAAAYKLRLAKEIEINQLKKEFPAWNTEYDDVAQGRWRRNVAAVHRVAYDPAIMADVKNYPHFEKVRAYFDFRANVQKVLYAQAEYKLRAKFGDRQFPKDVVVAEMGSIESDPRLVAIRDRIVKSFRSDEMFAYIYDRFLDADQFTPIPSWKESE